MIKRYYPYLLLLSLLSSAALAQRGDGQRLYRWVDDDGVVHYGDRVPPEYTTRDRDLLNEQGVAVGFEEGLVTDEERAAQAERDAAEQADRDARVASARRDRVLLDTYLSVAEIEALRDRRLELLESQIKVTEHYLANLRKRLASLEEEAGIYRPYNDAPDAPPMPANLRLDIDRTEASVDVYEQTLTRTREEQEALRAAFAEDIVRFRELKGI